jgi:hypothetical protein
MPRIAKRKIVTSDQVTIEEAPDGGYAARALGHSIFTEADTLPDLRDAVSQPSRRELRHLNLAESRLDVGR